MSKLDVKTKVVWVLQAKDEAQVSENCFLPPYISQARARASLAWFYDSTVPLLTQCRNRIGLPEPPNTSASAFRPWMAI
jgi:hypothetical protein